MLGVIHDCVKCSRRRVQGWAGIEGCLYPLLLMLSSTVHLSMIEKDHAAMCQICWSRITSISTICCFWSVVSRAHEYARPEFEFARPTSLRLPIAIVRWGRKVFESLP